MSQNTPYPITRIDFSVLPNGTVTVVKLGETPHSNGREVPLENSTLPNQDELDKALAWCRSHGWTVRQWQKVLYFPAGARAWKGEQKPVRTQGQIMRRRSELLSAGISGLVDLAYDL